MKMSFLLLFMTLNSQGRDYIFPDGEILKEESFANNYLLELSKLKEEELLIFKKEKDRYRYSISDTNLSLAPYLATINKESVHIELETKKKVLIRKDILVKVKQASPGSPYVLILDKQQRPKYLTLSSSVTPLNNVIKLSPQQKSKKVLSRKKEIHTEETKIAFQNHISLISEQRDLNDYSDIEESQVSLLGAKYKLLIDTNLPILLGTTFSYKRGEIEQSGGSYNSTNLGLTVFYNFQGALTPYIEAGRSLSEKLSITDSKGRESEYSLSNIFWRLGLNYKFKTFLGNFFIGSYIGQNYSTVKKFPNSNQTLPSQTDPQNSFGLSAGYITEITL